MAALAPIILGSATGGVLDITKSAITKALNRKIARGAKEQKQIVVVKTEKKKKTSKALARADRSEQGVSGLQRSFAPVAQGYAFKGVDYQFSAAPIRGLLHGVRLTAKQLWATCTADGTTGKAIFPYAGAAQMSQLTFDPDDTKTMPPPMTALASIFNRYCLRRARVTYTPAASTSSTVGLAMAVTSDPTQPIAGSFLQVLSVSQSVQTPVWNSASLEVPCDDTLRYTYQSVADGSLSVAENRQDHAFAMSALFNTAPAATTFGYYHLSYVIDFYELGSFANETSYARLVQRCVHMRAHLDREAGCKPRHVDPDEKKGRELEDYVLPPTPLRVADREDRSEIQLRAERRIQSLKG